jgi:hypothetical protein
MKNRAEALHDLELTERYMEAYPRVDTELIRFRFRVCSGDKPLSGRRNLRSQSTLVSKLIELLIGL